MAARIIVIWRPVSERDRALQIPILHLDAGELGRPGLIRRILSWAREQLGSHEAAG